jgi:CheY-like chemotaxis protein
MVPDAILLVEDSEDDVILTKCALEDAGIVNPVQAVSNADQAMAYLNGEGVYRDRTSYPLPCLIFIDLWLPGKSGHELLAWMAEQPALKSIVRVVLTGSENPADIKRARESGANGYICKPLTVEQLTKPGRNLQTLLRRPVTRAEVAST